MTIRVAAAFAIVSLVLLSVAGRRITPVLADVTGVRLVRCDLVAPAIDGDLTNETTYAELEFACQQPMPATGSWSIAGVTVAWGGANAVLDASDLAVIEASADNILDQSCTEAVLDCTMLLFAFVTHENPVTLDVPSGIASIEGGVADFVCTTEGSGSGQDADCAGVPAGNGDGVVVFHVLNGTSTNGQLPVVRVSQESVEYAVTLPVGQPAGPGDYDGDGVPTRTDNCPQDSNSGQQNTDSAPLTLAGAPNDTTVPTSDRDGDACDDDDDNDWLGDIYEPAFPMPVSPVGPCVPATAATLVLNADTDGDRVRDGAECVLGYDPASAASKPPAMPADDSDGDGLPDYVEDILGSNSSSKDSDGDGFTDGIEIKGYQSSPTRTDTDNDGCPDATEIASVNADHVVSALDLVAIATRFGSRAVAMMDINKDGIINALDLVLVAKAFNPVPCG